MNTSMQAEFVKRTIPTYETGKPMDLPFFFEKKPYQGASGKIYPLQFNDALTGNRIQKEYSVGVLENKYIRIEVMPEIGGKISRGYDKLGEYDFMYHNAVVKPALIGLAGPWISGGIEFNWPQHHRPTTFLPLAASIEKHEDGSATLWTGEVDPLLRMKGMAGITVDPSRSYCRVKVRIFNRTEMRQPFMWWANLAVPGNDDYQIIFPPDVEYMNDHDRRAVISWPIAKGIYHTARPYDFGEGTDLSWHSAIKVPSSFMVSEGQSEMDFVCGYDHKAGKGIVAWADHRIAPGKKLFHWGDGDFGNMWCSNLTDENGPYVELMTGVYTDNQPDFSWILPGETKEFEQYWYPIREIGPVKNATIDAALNMEEREGMLFFGVHATGCFPDAVITIRYKGGEVWSSAADLSCEQPWVKQIPWQKEWVYQDMSMSVMDSAGKILVSYKVPVRGIKKPIEPRKPVPRPSEIETIEELYIHGLHLEQYKHHTYDPKDYYLEALARDAGDIRCNTGMARISYRKGMYESCVSFCDTAIKRLLSRNEHATSVEVIYIKALALMHLNRDTEARPLMAKALWSYEYRSAALYELACMDCREGSYSDAMNNLYICIQEHPDHERARNLKAALLRKQGIVQANQNVEFDALDLWARLEQYFASPSPELLQQIHTVFPENPQWYFDVITEYLHAGLFEDALSVLRLIDRAYPMVKFYHHYLHDRLSPGSDNFPEYPEGENCFPNRPEDLMVLKHAVKNSYHATQASYLAGCLLYDKEQYEEATKYWEHAVALDSSHAYALRNLAIAYFDKYLDKRSARLCLEKAFSISRHPRILFEYQQLLKQSSCSIEERLSVYEHNAAIAKERDDSYLDWIMLLTNLQRYEEASTMISSRTFHIYEGGEGKLTKHHGWLYVLSGLSQWNAGDYDGALQFLNQALVVPKEYGEAKSWFAQEAHIHYFLGRILVAMGKDSQAITDAYKMASIPKSAVSEISLFRALALQQLSRYSEARMVLEEMLGKGQDMLDNLDRYAYFGVGSATPTPFDYDIKKVNAIEGGILKAYALLGFGRLEEAETELERVRFYNRYDFRLNIYEIISKII